ncbi:MAG: hypothetical protein NC418_04410 [Muribaculaceae bacterium]|nr:hypothetical protein [Muribaculaceae bacterium]
MAKTGKQIQGDVYRLLRDSTLYSLISGEVYRSGMRPRDSRKEDAIVTFTTGLPDEIQSGVVTVNIYVPDIDPRADGTWIEDGRRAEELERLTQEWVDSLTAEVSCYRFMLQQTIYTEAEPSINQHFVVVKLRYDYFGDDYAPLLTPQGAMIDAYDTDGDKGYLPIIVTEDGDVPTFTPTISKKHYDNL